MNNKGCMKIKRRKTNKLKQKNKLNCKTRKIKKNKEPFYWMSPANYKALLLLQNNKNENTRKEKRI